MSNDPQKISIHMDCEIGQTIGEPHIRQLPDGSWKVVADIETIFGSPVEGQLEGVGPTREAAMADLARARRQLNDSLWF